MSVRPDLRQTVTFVIDTKKIGGMEHHIWEITQGMQIRWKRILLFSLPFSVLAGSLIWIYVVPRVFPPPLRIDSIPLGVYVVPWMRPNPTIEELSFYSVDSPPWDIEAVMADALAWNITFRIEIPKGTRVVPSTVYLGHDQDYLYIGGKFRGMYKNPVSNFTPGPVLSNRLSIFLDVANDGLLTFPESGSALPVNLQEDAGWHTGKVWSYEDILWSYSPVSKRETFRYASTYYDPDAQPAFAVGNSITMYDNSTGTLIILFSRYLRRPELPVNGLQMRSGECWVMGFLLELGYNNWYGEWQDFVDGWPQKIYPYLSNDSSWWPKLVIDLTNPPPSFST